MSLLTPMEGVDCTKEQSNLNNIKIIVSDTHN